jgi:hypothetical protein
MSNSYEGGPISVNSVGATITSVAASTITNIPVDSAGNSPRYVRIAATQAAYVKVSTTATAAAATTSDILVQPADAIILEIPGGVTKIAAIRDTVDGKVNVVALDNV